MDEIVLRAMLKWPNVPDCFGWLGLDQRGQWVMRDDKVQAAGAFQSGQSLAKGSVLRHEKLIEFIGRNYSNDEDGQWFFQNGPQRVYVELEIAPHIWRVSQTFEVASQTGQESHVLACLEDEAGRVFLHTKLGLGLVHSSDVIYIAEAIEKKIWTIEKCQSTGLAEKYGYVMSPQNRQKKERKKTVA